MPLLSGFDEVQMLGSARLTRLVPCELSDIGLPGDPWCRNQLGCGAVPVEPRVDQVPPWVLSPTVSYTHLTLPTKA